MDIKTVITDVLECLVDKELKQFIWQLCKGVKAGIEPIPQAKLQTSDREDVVDCMVKQYPDDAGKIAVHALRNMKQNELAKRLELKLKEVQQPEQEDARNAPLPVNLQPIRSDWHRPYSITPCSQEFKEKILRDNKTGVYIPKDKSQWKGSALLITNIEFKYKEYNRHGAEIDEENMEWLLRALGYRVEKYRNLSGDEIDKAVKNFSKLYEHRDSDSTFVVIMSHGEKIDNKDAILGVYYHDTENPKDVFFVEDIFPHLNSVSCRDLIDKPKVILIKACRGGPNKGGVEVHDSVAKSGSWVHHEKDFACFMSTLPYTVSYRNPTIGSHFINYTLEVFCELAHKHHIMDLFLEVSARMATRPGRTDDKLLPCLERTSLTKKFYLFPGL